MNARKRTDLWLTLTEPQGFWLEILLESVLSSADPSRGTTSYQAVLDKIRRAKKCNERANARLEKTE